MKLHVMNLLLNSYNKLNSLLYFCVFFAMDLLIIIRDVERKRSNDDSVNRL